MGVLAYVYLVIFIFVALEMLAAADEITVDDGAVFSVGHAIRMRSIAVNLPDEDIQNPRHWRVNNDVVFTFLCQTENPGVCSSTPNRTVYSVTGIVNASKTSINSTLQLSSPFPVVMTLVIRQGSADSSLPVNITVKDCPEKKSDDYLIISQTNRTFEGTTSYECKGSSHLVVNGSSSDNFSQRCSGTADWYPGGKVACWYAPETQLLYNQSGIPGSQFLYAGQKLLLECNVTKQGFPDNYTEEFFFSNGSLISGDELVLKSELADASIYCQALDINYRKVISSSSNDGQSAPVWIDVRYPPKPAGNTKLNMSRDVESGEDITLQYQFQANPNSTLDNMTFTHFGMHNSPDIDIHGSCPGDICELKNDISKQTFLYEIPNVNQSRDGVYTLKVSSPDDHFVDDVLVMWINLTVVDQDPHDPRDPQTIIIIVVSVAVGLILILVGILIYMIRRKRAKGGKKQHSQHTPGGGDSDKQEKENPLYGTAGHFEKEERANPLYGTAGAVIEEATYSEVKKDKKTKKKGKENPGFSGENMGDTYAEVKKPKKTASTSAAVEPEVTYAALNKKKKKGPDQNVLHGSSEM